MNELFVWGTFVLVLVVFVGAYWALFEGGMRAAQTLLRQRLSIDAAAKVARHSIVKMAAERKDRKGAVNGVHRRAMSLQIWIEQSGLPITVSGLALATVGLGVLMFAVGAQLSGQLWVGAFGAVIGAVVPWVVVRMARTKRLRKFEEFFPEAIDLIARALRAGHTFTTGLLMVADEIPKAVAGEFRLLYDKQNYGMDLSEALRAFAARIPLIDAKFFVTAVLTQREAGGNLAEVLDNLAKVIRTRFTVQRQIRVISAHGRLTGGILMGLPLALGFFLALRSPENFTVLFSDPLGIRMIVVAAALQILGVFVIRRIVKIEY